MSATFLMKRAEGIRYHGSHVRTPLEFHGAVSMSGPQPVQDDGGVPELVHQLFQQFPKVQKIGLAFDGGGVVFQRLAPDEPHPQQENP